MIRIAFDKYGFFLENKLGQGNFGFVFEGINLRSREKVAIKVEPIEYNLKLLKNETKIYDFLKGTKGIPHVKWFGCDTKNYYMVMDLLSVSLETKLKQSKTKTFSLDLCFQLGKQALAILEHIHYRGIIHRDIKPDNFVLGFGENKNQVYLIDFGFCRTYRDANGAHISLRSVNSLIGSPKFASVHALNHVELSRRDDLESLGYMLCYFYLGDLDDDKTTTLLTKIPLQLKNYLALVSSLGFEEDPKYNELRDCFTPE
jgi:serine/threonine protein kinase